MHKPVLVHFNSQTPMHVANMLRQLHIVMLSITSSLLPFILLNVVIHAAACQCGPEWQSAEREFARLLEWHVSFDSHEHQLQWPQRTAAIIVEQPCSGV